MSILEKKFQIQIRHFPREGLSGQGPNETAPVTLEVRLNEDARSLIQQIKDVLKGASFTLGLTRETAINALPTIPGRISTEINPQTLVEVFYNPLPIEGNPPLSQECAALVEIPLESESPVEDIISEKLLQREKIEGPKNQIVPFRARSFQKAKNPIPRVSYLKTQVIEDKISTSNIVLSTFNLPRYELPKISVSSFGQARAALYLAKETLVKSPLERILENLVCRQIPSEILQALCNLPQIPGNPEDRRGLVLPIIQKILMSSSLVLKMPLANLAPKVLQVTLTTHIESILNLNPKLQTILAGNSMYSSLMEMIVEGFYKEKILSFQGSFKDLFEQNKQAAPNNTSESLLVEQMQSVLRQNPGSSILNSIQKEILRVLEIMQGKNLFAAIQINGTKVTGEYLMKQLSTNSTLSSETRQILGQVIAKVLDLQL